VGLYRDFFDSPGLSTLHWIGKQPATGGRRKLVELERSGLALQSFAATWSHQGWALFQIKNKNNNKEKEKEKKRFGISNPTLVLYTSYLPN